MKINSRQYILKSSSYTSSNIIVRVAAASGIVSVKNTVTADGTFAVNTAVYVYFNSVRFSLDY